ncbi:DUF2147 domain-containing protein [Martelella alba]|uniref:DUF2147 domain-containing protein n=1 Tax=Martelella alba TaxID=2590451 RepID=A0A506U6P4_9HYPH|nr:DUF2147 domain-containing protein [Martelella alba]TPW29178.1 DUF2147 domain-containing protein [Martelella alba]
MKRNSRRTLIAALVVACMAAPALAASPEGTWLTQSGKTKVTIAPCEAALCGTIVWLAMPGKDAKNPKAGARDRDLVGSQMIYAMQPDGEGWKGKLYDYENGKTYTGKISLTGDGGLKLSGCILGGALCRSQIWTRAQ